MDDTQGHLIQSGDPFATVLQVPGGFINDKGETYNKTGLFIDFPRELSSKQRSPRDPAAVEKQFNHQRVACLVHERRNYSYYHWTYETLPKLIFLNNHRNNLRIDKLYFHFGRLGHPYQRQALRRLGFHYWQIVDAKRVKSLMAKEIVVVKLNETRLQPSAALCQTIKIAFLPQPVRRPHRKIYLTRDHVKTGRKLINEAELRQLLRRHGFQIVVADALTVAQQAKLFNESSHIVSPHGAALANLAFCEPGAKILELFNQVDRAMWSPLYGTIAQVCGLELIPIAPQWSDQSIDSHHRSNFYTDLDAIDAALGHWEV